VIYIKDDFDSTIRSDFHSRFTDVYLTSRYALGTRAGQYFSVIKIRSTGLNKQQFYLPNELTASRYPMLRLRPLDHIDSSQNGLSFRYMVLRTRRRSRHLRFPRRLIFTEDVLVDVRLPSSWL